MYNVDDLQEWKSTIYKMYIINSVEDCQTLSLSNFT